MNSQGTSGLPVVLVPKNRFREKHFCTAAGRSRTGFHYYLFVLFSFFSFLLVGSVSFLFPQTPQRKYGREKERKKLLKSPKNNTRAWTSSDIWKCKNQIPFYDYQKRKGRMEGEKRVAFRLSLSGGNFRWSKTPECCFPFFFFHVIFPPPSVIFSTVSNLRGVQLLTGSR